MARLDHRAARAVCLGAQVVADCAPMCDHVHEQVVARLAAVPLNVDAVLGTATRRIRRHASEDIGSPTAEGGGPAAPCEPANAVRERPSVDKAGASTRGRFRDHGVGAPGVHSQSEGVAGGPVDLDVELVSRPTSGRESIRSREDQLGPPVRADVRAVNVHSRRAGRQRLRQSNGHFQNHERRQRLEAGAGHR